MRFVSDGPDVPDKLIELHQDGGVVFFCGAGISYPAGLPGFRGLVDRIYDEIGETQSASESLAYRQERFDAVIDLLERRLGDRQRVRKSIASALRPNLSLAGATDTHRALLTLSKTRDDRTRLLTTNFDRVFCAVDPTIQSIAAPLLPVPKRSRWDGLVYLHGLLPETDDAAALERLVASSGDFGLAYLTERWASRFVTELFRYYTICFVGYSINDPVLRYMMDALSADRLMGERNVDVYAFGSYKRGKEKVAEDEWRAKGVIPILYRERRNPGAHALLHRSLSEWARIYRDGLLGKQAIITREAQAKPSPVVGDGQIGRVLWALCDPSGVPARAFADMTPAPPIEWLATLDERRYLLGDLTRFGIDPRPEDDARLSFSLTHRPTPYRLAPWMTLASLPGGMHPQPDEVMFQLARWLARHLDKPDLLAWVLRRGGRIHDLFLRLIDDALSSSSLPGHIAVVWRMFVTGRVESHGARGDLFVWKDRLRTWGWVPSIRQEFLQLLEPCVRFSEALVTPQQNAGEDEHTSPRVRDFARWDIVLRESNLHSEFGGLSEAAGWKDAIADMLPELTEKLRVALDLMQELGGADPRHDSSYVHQPSITPHRQNRHFQQWTTLVELCRDAWVAAAERDPERAKRIATRWWEIPYPLFRRLTFFAATEPRVFAVEEALRFLLAEDAWWLWSVETQHEAIRLLVSLAPRLDGPASDRLLATILEGPPRELFRDDVEPENLDRARDRETWLLLEKYATAGGALSEPAGQRLTDLRTLHPQWQLQPDNQEEFPFWMGLDDSWRKQVTLPRELAALVTALEARPGADYWYEDDWQELCRSDGETAIAALRQLADRNLWPVEIWRQALQTFSEEALVAQRWDALAQLLRLAPVDAIHQLRSAISWWLRATTKATHPDPEPFFLLAHQVLDASVDDAIENDDDVVFRAINHPVGQVTEAVLLWWYATKPRDDGGLHDATFPFLNRVADPNIRIFRHGRLLMAAHAIALFRVDPAWAKANLLPRFEWRDSAEAQSAWEGFLWMPRLHKGLLTALKASFLATASHYEQLGEHGEQYADLLTLAALELPEIFPEQDLRTAFSKLPREGRVSAANMLLRAVKEAGESRTEYWVHRVRPFLERIWPKAADHRSPGISVALARVCIAVGTQFREAFELVRSLLVRAHDVYLATRELDASGRCSESPEAALSLLDLLVDDSQRPAREELAACLRQIREASPELEDTGAFRRLQTYLNRFNVLP